MNMILKIYLDKQWKDYPVSNCGTADFRLDEQLDAGSVMIITDSAEPIPPMSMTELTISDSENTLSMPAYCFDTVEVRGQGYYVHNLTLVEPTRLFMGAVIDGVKITQPQEESERESLYTVTERLLNAYKLLKWYTLSRFFLTDDEEIVSLLRERKSPQFDWEAETQLWECLKDVGSVINCMPRLTFNADKTAFNVVTFDKINDVTEEREL